MQKNNKKIPLRCLSTVLAIMPGHFAFRLVLSIGMSILPLLGMAMSRQIYAYVDASVLSRQPIGRLLFPLVIYALYLILSKAYLIYYQRVVVQFGSILEFEKRIKLTLHKKTGKIGMRYYEDPAFYNGLWEAKVASTNIYRVAECLIDFVSLGLSILVLSTYAATIEPAFFFLIILTAVPAFIEQVCEGRLKSRQQKKLASLMKEEKTRFSNITDVACAKERIVYGSYPFLKEKWENTIRQYQDTETEADRKILLFSALFSFIKTASVAAVYVLAGWTYFKGNVDYAGFMTTISVALFLQAQYSELFETAGYYSQFTMMVRPYFQFMDIETEVSVSHDENNEAITLKDAGFSYPSSDGEVLQDINIEIRPGEKIAIVGVNGAGKSTLAKILSGLLVPTRGEASGIDSGKTCVMFQDFQNYALSKEENITLNELTPSKPDALHELSDELELEDIPSGEILGREFGEVDLSGGQWQKVAMARLFYHGGSVLILDEPTSAIDPLYEKRLNDFIVREAADTTLIVISHRLSIAKLLDRIYVLKNGRIVENGTHEELLQGESSEYARLWDAQTSWYR